MPKAESALLLWEGRNSGKLVSNILPDHGAFRISQQEPFVVRFRSLKTRAIGPFALLSSSCPEYREYLFSIPSVQADKPPPPPVFSPVAWLLHIDAKFELRSTCLFSIGSPVVLFAGELLLDMRESTTSAL